MEVDRINPISPLPPEPPEEPVVENDETQQEAPPEEVRESGDRVDEHA